MCNVAVRHLAGHTKQKTPRTTNYMYMCTIDDTYYRSKKSVSTQSIFSIYTEIEVFLGYRKILSLQNITFLQQKACIMAKNSVVMLNTHWLGETRANFKKLIKLITADINWQPKKMH